MYRPDWDQMDLGVPIPELLFNEDLIGNDALAVDLEEHLGNAHYVQEDDIKREKIDNFFTNFFAVENQLKDEHILPEQSIDNDISLSEVYGDIFYDDIDQHEDSMQGSPNSSASGSMSEEETQALIEDMEEFLTQHEAFDFQEEAKVQGDPLVTDAETEQAEKILDALIHGDVSLGNISGAADQLGNGLISNISEIVGANGQKIYIVITNDLENPNTTLNTSALEDLLSSPIAAPSPQSSIQSGASSPDYSSFAGDDASDSDWSPASPQQKSRGGRASKTASSASRKQSGPRRKATVDSYRGIKDKKERKKVQNVHAARRYREKKKTEQGGIEAEEEEALAKNRELKTKLSEMESEVKTLKKLMAELGIVKMLAAKK